MRQKNKNHRNQGSNEKKKIFFGSVPKSPTQMGSRSAQKREQKIFMLGHLEDPQFKPRRRQL
jgi:hypothetical protein